MKTSIKLLCFFALISFFSCSKSGDDEPAFDVPSLSGVSSSNVAAGGATLWCDNLDDGGMEVFEKGFILSTIRPVYAANDPLPSSGVVECTGDEFSYQCTGLLANTTYYFVAYAKNDQGIGYSSVASFTTLEGVSAPVTLLSPTGISAVQYSSSGFDGTSYNYKMSYTVNVEVSDYTAVTRVGYEIGGQQWYWDSPTYNGTYSKEMYTRSMTSTVSSTITAFAMLNDGTKYTGNSKTVSGTYSGGTGGGGTGGGTGSWEKKISAQYHYIGDSYATSGMSDFTASVIVSYSAITDKYYLYESFFNPGSNGGKGLRYDAKLGYNSIRVHAEIFGPDKYGVTHKLECYCRFTIEK